MGLFLIQVISGESQGRHPVLFCLIVNSLGGIYSSNVDILLYVDDIEIFYKVKSINDC